MCIPDPISTSARTSKEEDNFRARKRGYHLTNLVCLERSSSPCSIRSFDNDQASWSIEANSARGKRASMGIMANLEAFRRVHRQNGTDFLTYYQQTGLIAVDL